MSRRYGVLLLVAASVVAAAGPVVAAGGPGAALAFARHRGMNLWGMRDRHAAAALPRGVANVPEPGTASVLFGVYCTSLANCWAVGFYQPSSGTEGEFNEALHWNGTTWSQVTTPNPGGTASGDVSALFSVRCTSASNCWAAGESQASAAGGAMLNQALHWNGRKWSLAATPNPGGTSASSDVSQLFDVVCPSATNCWAVGQAGSSLAQTANQALHWNGTAWKRVTTPNPGGTSANDVNTLSSVRCPAARTCLAAGTMAPSSARPSA
jgi:hypothetical protein